jgi:hypothetical protein
MLTRKYEICNTGTAPKLDQTITTSTPAGYVYAEHVAEIGTYDPGTLLWTIGSVPVGECYDLVITYVAHATDSGCSEGDCEQDPIAEPINLNHGNVYTVQGKLPCTALCDRGTTVIEVTSFSPGITVDMEVSSGNYVVTVLDATQDWEFQYTVTCYDCDETFGPFGPGVVSGEAVQVLPPYVPTWNYETFTLSGGETEVVCSVELPDTLPAQIWVTYNQGELTHVTDYIVDAEEIQFVGFTGGAGDVVTVRWIEY